MGFYARLSINSGFESGEEYGSGVESSLEWNSEWSLGVSVLFHCVKHILKKYHEYSKPTLFFIVVKTPCICQNPSY